MIGSQRLFHLGRPHPSYPYVQITSTNPWETRFHLHCHFDTLLSKLPENRLFRGKVRLASEFENIFSQWSNRQHINGFHRFILAKNIAFYQLQSDKQPAFRPKATGFSSEYTLLFGRKQQGSQSKAAYNAVVNTLLLDRKHPTMPIHTPKKRRDTLFLPSFSLYFRFSEKGACQPKAFILSKTTERKGFGRQEESDNFQPDTVALIQKYHYICVCF